MKEGAPHIAIEVMSLPCGEAVPKTNIGSNFMLELVQHFVHQHLSFRRVSAEHQRNVHLEVLCFILVLVKHLETTPVHQAPAPIAHRHFPYSKLKY